MSESVIKALLQLGIQLAGRLIPWLGGFLAGPFGFIASFLISWLTGKLYAWLEQMARYNKIDVEVQADLVAAKDAQVNLRKVQDDKNATGEQRAKALADFTTAVGKFGRFKLQ